MDDKSNPEIAKELNCSVTNVENCLRKVYCFYGVHSSRGLIRMFDKIAEELSQSTEHLIDTTKPLPSK